MLEATGDRLPAPPRKRPDAGLAEGACQKDLDCGPTLARCDEESQRCVEPDICLTDLDCTKGRLCQYGKCVDKVEGCRLEDCMPQGLCNIRYGQCEKIACKTNEDCAGPRVCHVESTICVECLTDTDCEGGATCMPGRFCMPKGGCGGDGNCEEGALCDTRTWTCDKSKCIDDPREDDDKWSSAKDLETGDHEFMSCPADNDFFKLEISQGEGFVVQTDFRPGGGMIELRLHDQDGLEIKRAGDSKLTGDVALVWPRAEKDSIYYLGVLHEFGVKVPYRLSFAVWPGGFCENDRYEPNDDSDEATTLTHSVRWTMKLCEGDDDWFLQSVKAGESLDLFIATLEGEIPRVEVFRDEEPEPILVDDSSRDEKVLLYKSDRAADYYIRFSPMFAHAESMYDIKIEVKR